MVPPRARDEYAVPRRASRRHGEVVEPAVQNVEQAVRPPAYPLACLAPPRRGTLADSIGLRRVQCASHYRAPDPPTTKEELSRGIEKLMAKSTTSSGKGRVDAAIASLPPDTAAGLTSNAVAIS